MEAATLLEHPSRLEHHPVYVVHGEEEFLRRQSLRVLRQQLFGSEENDLGYNVYPGEKADFAAVRDELATLSFLAPTRLVLVENADPFVTRFRPQLEKYVAEPSSHGVLVLEVKSWPANTKLAKVIPAEATIVCKPPPAYRLPDWCVKWAASQHGKQLTQDAAKLLVDLVGPEMGLLDQELAKLAVYVGEEKRIDALAVDKLVASSRSESVWKLFDAIGAGQTAEALNQLNQLLDQGEEPLKILGAFGLQLRRLAQVARLNQQGMSLHSAMQQAGVLPFAQKGFEQQLRHLGRRRLNQLHDWLLELNMGLRGDCELPPRVQLERLVLRLVRPSEPAGSPGNRT